MTDPVLKYKAVLSPSTDTDPPTNPIATWNGLLAINPPFMVVADLPTPYNYGAVGDGVADDTVALQNWLNAIQNAAGFGKAGTFMVSGGLSIGGATTIYGAGQQAFVIQTSPDFPTGQQLLTNKHLTSGPPVDTKIAIYGCCFQGSSTQETAAEMIGFVGIDGLIIRDCLFQHWRGFILAFSFVNNVVIENCEITDWGHLTPATDPNNYEGGSAIIFVQGAQNYRILNNNIHDGQWGAIALSGDNATVQGNEIRNVMEWGIFGSADFSVISDNVIGRVVKKAIAGHGMETGGIRVVISDNVISYCDLANIYLTNPTLVNVTGNVLDTPNQSAAIGFNSGSTGNITVRNAGATQVVNNLSITDNQLSDFTGHSTYGIVFYNFGSVGPMNNVDVHGNNLAGTTWAGSAISTTDGASNNPVGTNFMIRDNLGAETSDLSTSAVSFVIPSGTTGSFTVLGVGFYSSRIEFLAVNPGNSVKCSSGQQTWLSVWDVISAMSTVTKSAFLPSGIAWSADGSAGWSEDFAGRSAVQVLTVAGHPICVGKVTAVNADGFTFTIDSMPLVVTVNAAGSGYAAGDTGTIAGGDGLAVYTVLTLSGSTVLTVSVAGGTGYVNATGATTTPTTGAGNAALTLDFLSSSPTTADVVVTAICHA